MIKQFSSYMVVGYINFIVCITVMFVMQSCQLHYITYTISGYLCSMVCSYLLNRRYTFPATKRWQRECVLFFLINGINLIFTALLEMVLIETIDFTEWDAVILGMCFYTIVGFFTNRWVVFVDLHE